MISSIGGIDRSALWNDIGSGDIQNSQPIPRLVRITPPQWNDSQQSALALRDVGANVPILTQYGATNIYMPMFTVGDFVTFQHQFSHGLKQVPNVLISPHIHWVGSTTDAVHAVRWELTYQWLNNLQNIAPASTVLPVDDFAVADQLRLIDFPDIIKAGALISSIFMGRLRRISNGGVDYAGNVFMSFFDIHYTMDTMGSDQELVKS